MLTCGCVSEMATVAERLRSHFRRGEAREYATDSLRRLLADVERKHGWQLAEQVGYAHPRGIQREVSGFRTQLGSRRVPLVGWSPDQPPEDA